MCLTFPTDGVAPPLGECLTDIVFCFVLSHHLCPVKVHVIVEAGVVLFFCFVFFMKKPYQPSEQTHVTEQGQKAEGNRHLLIRYVTPSQGCFGSPKIGQRSYPTLLFLDLRGSICA